MEAASLVRYTTSVHNRRARVSSDRPDTRRWYISTCSSSCSARKPQARSEASGSASRSVMYGIWLSLCRSDLSTDRGWCSLGRICGAFGDARRAARVSENFTRTNSSKNKLHPPRTSNRVSMPAQRNPARWGCVGRSALRHRLACIPSLRRTDATRRQSSGRSGTRSSP